MAMEARRRTIRIVLVVMVMVFVAECLPPVLLVLVYILGSTHDPVFSGISCHTCQDFLAPTTP